MKRVGENMLENINEIETVLLEEPMFTTAYELSPYNTNSTKMEKFSTQILSLGICVFVKETNSPHLQMDPYETVSSVELSVTPV